MENKEFEVIHYNRKREIIDVISRDCLKIMEDTVRQIILKELED